MLDPEIIPSLRRRIAAFAVDFGLVTVLTGLVGRSRFQEFELERTPGTNELIPTAEQFEAISKLAEGFNRKIERGDSWFIIDGMGVLLTLLVGTVLSIIFFVAVPANTGWSPGKRLFGLRVIDTDGGTPTLLSFFARSIVGLIDLLPVVVPGLLGFFLASRHTDRHRLGDRIAGTTVVDARRPVRFVDPAVMERRATLREDDQDVTDDESMVDLGDRLGSAPPPADVPPRARDLLETTVQAATADEELASPPPVDRPEPHPQVQVAPRSQPESYPPPQVQPGPRPQVEASVDLASSSAAAERPLGSHPPPTHRGVPEAGHGRPISETEARTWEPPVAEPAPVWIAGETLPQQASSSQNTSSQAEARQQGVEAAPGASAAVAEVVAPVWNEQWHAWLFWDAEGQRWLRHDESTGDWVPIS